MVHVHTRKVLIEKDNSIHTYTFTGYYLLNVSHSRMDSPINSHHPSLREKRINNYKSMMIDYETIIIMNTRSAVPNRSSTTTYT